MKIFPRWHFQWNLAHGRTLALGPRTLVMGIVNLTHDSFSDGGSYVKPQQAIDHALRLLDEGADLLDLGAESTRPGATLTLQAAEEQRTLEPVLKGILRARPGALLSVDTFHAPTARFAVEHGAHIINDVSGFLWDEAMVTACAELSCGLVLMHTRGKPNEWATQRPLDVEEVMPLVTAGLQFSLALATQRGIDVGRIVLDPGFGFGKRGQENIVLLHHIAQLHALGRPLLIGLSRKGFLAPHLAPLERDEVTSLANEKAIQQGAHIVRVHNVALAKQSVSQADATRTDDRTA